VLEAAVKKSVAIAAACAAVLSAPLLGAPAQAADDTTGPTLAVPPISAYVVGQQVGDPIVEDGTLWYADKGAFREYTWTASDPSGICRYTIDEFHNVEDWYIGVQDLQTSDTSGRYSFFADDYENSDDMGAVRFNAYDCAGNVTSVERPGDYTNIERDYGSAVPSGWRRSTCACAIGDTMLTTRKRGVSLATVVNTGGADENFALIMTTGPKHGLAAVSVDGARVATVDTYSPQNVNRVVAWNTTLSGNADHTITVQNLATRGRARITVDAYLH
jgi:hypothetical protein